MLGQIINGLILSIIEIVDLATCLKETCTITVRISKILSHFFRFQVDESTVDSDLVAVFHAA